MRFFGDTKIIGSEDHPGQVYDPITQQWWTPTDGVDVKSMTPEEEAAYEKSISKQTSAVPVVLAVVAATILLS